MIVCAALSRSTSAMPSSSVAITTTVKSSHSVPTTADDVVRAGQRALPASTASATTAASAKRQTSMLTINRRRSTRSVMTPAGSENTSHGSRPATGTSEIRSGLRVTADASHG